MKMHSRILLALTAAAALSFAHPASVQADTTYEYTGNPFTSATGPYTMSDFVTALVTLAAPLAPNMPFTTVTPLAFSLSDGLQTISNVNAATFVFHFATGPSGLPTQWFIIASVGAPLPGDISTEDTPMNVVDIGFQDGPLATIFDDPRHLEHLASRGARHGLLHRLVVFVPYGVGCSGPAVQAGS